MATNKKGSNNPMQKGERRQKLNQNKDNVGDPKNKSQFTNFNGISID